MTLLHYFNSLVIFKKQKREHDCGFKVAPATHNQFSSQALATKIQVASLKIRPCEVVRAARLRFFRQVHFALPILFVLTLAFDRAILYGNIALSIIAFSNIQYYYSFLKKILVFQKTLKVKVLKMLKISSDCQIKRQRSYKRRAILEINCTAFQRNLR